MLVAPVTAVCTAEVPQLREAVAGDELLTVTLGGNESVIEKLVKSVSPGAVILIRKREFSPAEMVSVLNDLLADIPAPGAKMRTRAVTGLTFVTP